MTDLLLSSSPISLTYHLENPTRQDWTTVMTVIAKELGYPPSCLLEFEEWARLMGQKIPQDRDVGSDILMEFLVKDFQQMSAGGIVLDTSKTQQVSATLRNAGGVSGETIVKYVQAWKDSGLLL